jgi:hypothetical protein
MKADLTDEEMPRVLAELHHQQCRVRFAAD